MNFQNYTQKSMEAVQNAKNLAIQNSNQQMEQVHLLVALLQQDGGLVPQLLKKMDVTVERVWKPPRKRSWAKSPPSPAAGKLTGSISVPTWMQPLLPPKQRPAP